MRVSRKRIGRGAEVNLSATYQVPPSYGPKDAQLAELLDQELEAHQASQYQDTWSPDDVPGVWGRAPITAAARSRQAYAKALPLRHLAKQISRVVSRPSINRAWFCFRRKSRRQVLFARRVAGSRGVGFGKRWRFTPESQVSCR